MGVTTVTSCLLLSKASTQPDIGGLSGTQQMKAFSMDADMLQAACCG